MVRLNNPFKVNGTEFGESDFRIPGHDWVTLNACTRSLAVVLKLEPLRETYRGPVGHGIA